ncbi:hypothetical protein PATA110616_01805 [Paenibacillus tarimensis]
MESNRISRERFVINNGLFFYVNYCIPFLPRQRV